jgi:hypothetical protein
VLNIELEERWKEAAVTYFEEDLVQKLVSGETEGNQAGSVTVADLRPVVQTRDLLHVKQER